MANLSITRRCQRRCGYCFAKYELTHGAETDMPPETYETALDFLERSGFPEVRLLGGEPTEHPRFREYVDKALERSFRVVVFSGGLVPQAALDHMATLPSDRLCVVLNTADPVNDPAPLVKRQKEVCRTLGERVMLGINIYDPDQDASHVFEWVAEHGLCRTIRVGAAHPAWGGGNGFLRLRPLQPVSLFERLVAMGAEVGVEIGFDCGFTPCMFSSSFVDSHADLFMPPKANRDDVQTEGLVESVGVRCNPVVDILPEGECIACYALSRAFRLPLCGNRDELVAAFNRELEPMLPVGIYRDCAHCNYRKTGMCNGGCRARRAQRLRPDPLVALDTEPTNGMNKP